MVDVDKAVIARLTTHGADFEILVDCDKAVGLKEGKDVQMSDVLAAYKIFSDAKKGLLASEVQLRQIFSTTDPAEIAKQIIKKGEVQLTAEYKAKLREEKKKKIMNYIQTNGVDPKTDLPHPLKRIEIALQEAKIHVHEFVSVEKQIEDALSRLRPILPISFEKKTVSVKIPSEYAGKAYSSVREFGKMLSEDWQGNGDLIARLEMPAGMVSDLMDRLGKMTRGETEIKILDNKQR